MAATEEVKAEQVPQVDAAAQKEAEEEKKARDEANKVIVPGPEWVDKDGKYHEKKLKTILKEGGKRGVEIEGAADMGGLQFFNTVVEKPEGDIKLLVECMKAMNALSDPTEEERKGGAGRLGKMIFSCTAEKLAIVAYVPSDKSESYEKTDGKEGCHAKEWLTHVVNLMCDGEKNAKAASADYVTGCSGEGEKVPEANWAMCLIEPSEDLKKEKNLFPLKLRDPAITHANEYLKKRGLFPDADSDDEDEMVFGDDDFP